MNPTESTTANAAVDLGTAVGAFSSMPFGAIASTTNIASMLATCVFTLASDMMVSKGTSIPLSIVATAMDIAVATGSSLRLTARARQYPILLDIARLVVSEACRSEEAIHFSAAPEAVLPLSKWARVLVAALAADDDALNLLVARAMSVALTADDAVNLLVAAHKASILGAADASGLNAPIHAAFDSSNRDNLNAQIRDEWNKQLAAVKENETDLRTALNATVSATLQAALTVGRNREILLSTIRAASAADKAGDPIAALCHLRTARAAAHAIGSLAIVSALSITIEKREHHE